VSRRLVSGIAGSALIVATSFGALGSSGARVKLGCPTAKTAGIRIAPRADSGCPRTQVLFSFHARGLPNEPDDNHLPKDLVAVELRTEGTRLLSVPGLNTYEPEGKILITTIYHGQATKLVEREIVLRPFGYAGYYESDAGERAVGFRARVSASNDRNCREGVIVQPFFGGALAGDVRPHRAIVRFGPAEPGKPLACLTGLTDDETFLEWNAWRYFESAKISRPKPIN
jgi:hypothetical protein